MAMPQLAEPAPQEAEITTVAAVFSLMTRLLGALAEHRVFKQAELGLAEWSALRALAEHPEWRSGRISRHLGITPQRTAQLVASLKAAGFITVTSSESDARKKDLALTPAGKGKLVSVDEEVLALVAAAFKDRPAAGMKKTQRNVQRLLKVVRPPRDPDSKPAD